LFDDQQGRLWQWNLRPIDAIAVEPGADEIPFEPLVEVALAHRSDLKSLRNQVAEAELALLQADRDTLPALDLVGAYSSDGVGDTWTSAYPDSLRQEFPDWSLRLLFSIPIGNQAARSRRRFAELELERRQRVLYGAMMDVAKDVRDAVRNLERTSQSIRASGESVRLAESNLETEQVKLRVGSSTAFEVQRRNQELREARSRHLRNHLDHRISQNRLLHAQGILEVPRE
jgi:outer membrane protein TolC